MEKNINWEVAIFSLFFIVLAIAFAIDCVIDSIKEENKLKAALAVIMIIMALFYYGHNLFEALRGGHNFFVSYIEP